MKPVFTLLIAMLLAPAARPQALPDTVRLPKDTVVHLRLDQDVSSATVHEGDRVRYVVADHVIVDGVVAIPAGTAAYRKVTSVVVASPSGSCRDVHNGWFALNDNVVLSSNGTEMKMRAWRQQDLPKAPPLTPKQKALAVALAPLQVPAMAIFLAAPVVLIPVGIAEGIHDSLHRSPKPSPAPQLLAPQQTLLDTQSVQSPLLDSSHDQQPTEAAYPAPALLPPPVARPPMRVVSLSPISPSLPSAATPCPADTHEEEWTASGAGVQNFYLVRDYTVRARASAATSAPEPKTEAQ